VGVAGNRICVPWGSFYTPDINWVSRSVKKETEITKGEGSQMRRLMVKKSTEALRNWLQIKIDLFGRIVLSNKCNDIKLS